MGPTTPGIQPISTTTVTTTTTPAPGLNKQTMVSKAAVPALTKAKAELTAVKYHNFTSIYAPSPGMRDAEFEESDSNVSVDVKGRLAAHVPFWESIGASPFVLSVLKEGYQFPLISEPPRSFKDNNKSASLNSDFVTQAVLELLGSNRIKEVFTPPHVVNPLSVSSKGTKKRLILDLREVNLHVFKTKIKFDDWKVMQDFIRTGGFMFKFDLKQGYHHVDIHPEFQQYLGFSWVIGGVRRYFVFTVLPFGLTSAPYIFTKIVRVLVKFWRKSGVKLCCFIDDGLGASADLETAKTQSDLVRTSLRDSGFVANDQKSVWEPSQATCWLGIVVDLGGGFLRVSDARESNILSLIRHTLANAPFTSARKLSKLTGMLLSTKFILGNLVRLKTRQFYSVINSSPSWDARVSFAREDGVIRDLHFWLTNFVTLNRKPITPPSPPALVVTSDASESGLAAHLDYDGTMRVSYRNFSEEESRRSSTWRELSAIVFSLRASRPFLTGAQVFWRTDNFAASLIATSGSRVDALQSLAETLYELCSAQSIRLEVVWTPRRSIQTADALSKLPDHDDWETSPSFFEELDALWGPHDVDRFADDSNAKVSAFNSKFYCPVRQCFFYFMGRVQ
jgi:hypothetical protein